MSATQSALSAPPALNDQRGDATQPSITATNQASWGDASRFAAAYETRATTLVNNAGSSEGYMIFDSQAYAFNEGKDVIIGTMFDITNGPSKLATVYANLYVLGNQVRAVTHGGGVFNNPFTLASVNQTLWGTDISKATPIASLGPIAFKASAQLAGYANQTIQGRAWYDGTKATLTQSAGVTVTAAAALTVLGVSAGVQLTNLRLIDLGESLNATAQINPCSTVTVGETGSLFLRSLGGSLDAFLSFPLGLGKYTANITSWPGTSSSTNLVNVTPATRSFSTPCFSVPTPPSF